MEDYMTIRETAEKWGLSVRRVQEICKLEKAPGIIKFGREWAIPRGAEKPSDLRITSGKYIVDFHSKCNTPVALTMTECCSNYDRKMRYNKYG